MDINKRLLVAIEGCDGVGKETQVKLFAKKLLESNVDLLVRSFPNYDSRSSEMVKLFLSGFLETQHSNQRTAMYGLDRSITMNKKEVVEFMSKEEHGVVLCDRYMSSIIYDTPHIKDEDLEKIIDNIYHIECDILHVPKPDLIIMLDLDDVFNDKVIAERIANSDTDIYESDNGFLSSIRTNIRRFGRMPEICKKYNIRVVKCNDEERRFTEEEVLELILNEYKNIGGNK